MAGFREFVTGEVLTAGNVNDYLMQQAVMKFADASARDTALGTAVGGGNALREGMVAWLDSSDELQAYDGTSWSSVGGLPLGTATPTDGQILAFGTATSTWNPTDQLAGIGSNVVQAVKTDIFSTSSTSFTDVTDLTVTITPSSATAKVLVIVQLVVGSTTNGGGWRINGNGGATTYVGDAAGSRNRVLSGIGVDSEASGITYAQSGVFLASPNSTSAETYKVEAKASGSATFYVNRNGTDADNANHYRFASSITAIEVAA